MTQRMMVPAAKPDDPSSIPGTLTWWKEGDDNPQVTCDTCCYTRVPTAYEINK